MASKTLQLIKTTIVSITVREKNNVSRIYTWIKSHRALISAAILTGLILLAFLSVTTDKIEVGPFTVPRAYEDRGYTQEAVASAVVDLIHGNGSQVSFERQWLAGEKEDDQAEDQTDEADALTEIQGSKVESSFDTSVTGSIQIPRTSFTIGSLRGVLRELVGRQVTRVSGQIVFAHEEEAGKPSDQRQVLIRYVIEYPEPSHPILGYHWWSRQVTTKPEQVIAAGAEDAIRKLAFITAECVNERTLIHEQNEERAVRYVARGHAYAGLQDFDRAERMYEQAEQLSHTSARAHLAKGLAAERSGEYVEADKQYKQAMRSSGENNREDVPWAELYLANLSVKRNAPRELVESYYKTLMNLNGKVSLDSGWLAQADAYNNLGFYYLAAGDVKDAEPNLLQGGRLAEELRALARECAYSEPDQKACGANADDWQKVKARALLYVDLTNFQISRSAHGLGELRSKSGNLNSAEDFYRKAIRANPKHARSHHKLGILLSQQNRLREANREYATEAALKQVKAR